MSLALRCQRSCSHQRRARFAQNAAPLVALFVEHELSATFVQELEAAIARFEDAIEDHADKRGLQVAATASIGDAMEKAMDVLYRLDGMVTNKIKKNPDLRMGCRSPDRC